MDRDRAVRLVSERLGVLPFCAGSYPQAGAEPGDPAGDLVAAVFPHARPAQNTATARYVAADGDGGAPAGSFVTLLTEDGVQVTCVARFLAGPDGRRLGAGRPRRLGRCVRGGSACLRHCPSSSPLGDGGRGVILVRSAMAEAPIAEPAATAGAG